jgi:hypothetical protein
MRKIQRLKINFYSLELFILYMKISYEEKVVFSVIIFNIFKTILHISLKKKIQFKSFNII